MRDISVDVGLGRDRKCHQHREQKKREHGQRADPLEGVARRGGHVREGSGAGRPLCEFRSPGDSSLLPFPALWTNSELQKDAGR